ncbi:hypothetical protein [Dyadobacter sp. LHD-138]|uniref:hypothetical protein n=1 Tax=Dyadobacter sp. LHD-138 TaxID=3071413 RepID=UPI0027E1AB20|nr:hypothetical protein [Dyadobacter sp. LHD-138]MDQ6477419.1 hypothetical protein [Dyadobacter sp. LHD-138]
MNSFDLEKLELNSLNDSEIQETNGGIWKELALLVIAGCVADWADFKSGLGSGLRAN